MILKGGELFVCRSLFRRNTRNILQASFIYLCYKIFSQITHLNLLQKSKNTFYYARRVIEDSGSIAPPLSGLVPVAAASSLGGMGPIAKCAIAAIEMIQYGLRDES